MHNITLIGMPGAGKSTVGVVLAKAIGYKFIDTDLVIQEDQGMVCLWQRSNAEFKICWQGFIS